MQTKFFERLCAKRDKVLADIAENLAVADGRPLHSMGRGRFLIKVGQLEAMHDIWVADIDADVLLGCDFKQRFDCTIATGKEDMTIGGLQQSTVEEKLDRCRVVSARTVVVPASSEGMATARVPGWKMQGESAIVECSEKFLEKHPEMIARAIVDPNRETIPLRLMNPTSRPLPLYEGTTVGECLSAEEKGIEEKTVARRKTRERSVVECKEKYATLDEHLHKLAEQSSAYLGDAEAILLIKLLADNADVFARCKRDLSALTWFNMQSTPELLGQFDRPRVASRYTARKRPRKR
ncbi:hypothetical protein BSL78_21924 [Apostichopus japonicus]|uniref:Uncharacterized protein n=1 Tax=Stichopus japonicus TaxID=307972 RepID=A0A2G8JZN0_STIJA|nr:hypothetical protein BSL78_21924 [Apostichopus japonicus]